VKVGDVGNQRKSATLSTFKATNNAVAPLCHAIPYLDLLVPFKTLESWNRYQTIYNIQQISYKSGKVPDGLNNLKEVVKRKIPRFTARTREKIMLIKPNIALCLRLKM
jgi:hypothetical protein